jgi:hypothetical protein
MAQEFNEEVIIHQPGTTRRTILDGIELFILENDRLRLSLMPPGLFFHHPAGHNTIELDAVNGDIRLSGAIEIGIGATTPSLKLEVVGSARILGSAFIGGPLTVGGGLSVVGLKSFLQPHPTDATKNIVYVALEGGEAGTYIRGTGSLVNGEAVVNFPEHFTLVTADEGLTVQLTPRGQWLQLYVAELNTQRIIVREAQKGSGPFDYLVQGVRKGYEHHQVIQDQISVQGTPWTQTPI